MRNNSRTRFDQQKFLSNCVRRFISLKLYLFHFLIFQLEPVHNLAGVIFHPENIRPRPLNRARGRSLARPEVRRSRELDQAFDLWLRVERLRHGGDDVAEERWSAERELWLNLFPGERRLQNFFARNWCVQKWISLNSLFCNPDKWYQVKAFIIDTVWCLSNKSRFECCYYCSQKVNKMSTV